jgi:hypothetical protein
VDYFCEGTVGYAVIDGKDTYYCYDSAGECTGYFAITPLVLVFGDGDVHFVADDGRYSFGLAADGGATRTDWPTAATPWLTVDHDGDGIVSSATELFGSATPLADGTLADNGFVALAQLDANGDRIIDETDPGFHSLLVWSDRDANRQSSRDELQTLSALGIIALEVDFVADRRCDARGNCAVERARFAWTDADGVIHQGAIVDVYPAVRDALVVPIGIAESDSLDHGLSPTCELE